MNTCTNSRAARCGLVVALAGALAACAVGNTGGTTRDGGTDARRDGSGGDAASEGDGARDALGPDAPAVDAPAMDAPDTSPPDATPMDSSRGDAAPEGGPRDASADAIEAGCPMGATTCAGTDGCVDTQRDPRNCGTCGNACPAGQACTGGTCACPTGQSACGTRCVDSMGDRENCGMCGRSCSAAQMCVRGMCTCPMGLSSCGAGASAMCLDLATDSMNCGTCGTVCPAGRTCVAGECACPTGQTGCGTGAEAACVNTRTDNANCGACGNACGAGSACVMGACACTMGGLRCGGACVNTASDAMNCGGCGTVCPAGQLCNGGTCQVGCTAPRARCGTGAAMVCTDPATDPANCGACGNACGAVANSSMPTCMGGTCRTTCAAGFENCDGTYANGCEVNTTNSPTNCGSCGMRCPSTAANASSVACAAGACQAVCVGDSPSARYRDCNGSIADGCEVNINDSRANCGACGAACGTGLDCVAGVCVVPSCNELHVRAPALPSGTYTLDPDGAGPEPAFSAYCDMTSDGGGWTLLLKIDGRMLNTDASNTSQFLYESPLWTNDTTLNTTSTDAADLREAKFAGYSSLGFSRLRIVMRDFSAGATDRAINFPMAAGSLLALFNGAEIRTNAGGRTGWGQLVADPGIQFNCGVEGINVAAGFSARIRLGIHGNQENECDSPDSFLGLGPTNDYVNTVGPGFGRTSSGNFAVGAWGDGAYTGDRTTRTFSWLYVR